MSKNGKPPGWLEIRDADGQVVGHVVPNPELQRVIGAEAVQVRQLEEKVANLNAEKSRLLTQLQELQRAFETLKERETEISAELRSVTEERDIYHKSLLHCLRSQDPISEEEVAEILQNRVPFAEVLRELGLEVSEQD